MEISCLIIDDELLSRKRISTLLEKWTDIKILGECANGFDAISKINDLKPEVVFLDVELKDMNGFDIINTIDSVNIPIIIFITAHDNYALDSYNIFAFDYLLKPYDSSRFDACVKNLITYVQKNNLDEQYDVLQEIIRDLKLPESNVKKNVLKSKFPIKLGKKTIFINISDVKYIIASGSYSEIHLLTKKITLRDSLLNIENKMDNEKFIRVHRSAIINVEYILEIIRSGFNEVNFKMNDGKLFRLSKSYRKEVMKILNL